MATPSDLLDPRALARIGHLELIAREIVEGFLRGLHRSPFKGSSVEFAEHRPYVPGDEITHIDWRAYARTDRFYLRQYEDETNLRATVCLDASASMGFGSAGLTKFRYAQCLAAALGMLLTRALDSVGLVVCGPIERRYLPPRSSAAHLRAYFAELDRARPEGGTALGPALLAAAERVKRRALAVVISDLLDDPGAILRGLARFRSRNSQVILFHVLDPAELEFPFTSWTIFRDMEPPGRKVRLDGRAIRAAYLKNLEAHGERIRKGCGSMSLDYCRIDTRTPFDRALARFLAHRRHWGR